MTVSLEYLAGFFDGEGSILSYTSRKAVLVRVSNTYKPVLVEFMERFGGAVYVERAATSKHKALYYWAVSRQSDVAEFLVAMQPLLLEKQRQANVALVILSIKLGASTGDVGALLRRLSELKHERLETPR